MSSAGSCGGRPVTPGPWGVQEPFLHRLVPVVVEVMGDAYPGLRQREKHCCRVILAEEEAFLRTLDKGLEIFAALAKEAKANKGTPSPVRMPSVSSIPTVSRWTLPNCSPPKRG